MSPVPKELIRTKSDEAAIKEGCVYDHEAAVKVRRFLEEVCVQSKAPFAGQPLTPLPWQWDRLIRPLYGLKRPDGQRLKTRAQLWCAKKNGKTTLLSGLALYHLLEQAGSEVLILAGTVEQAGVLYKEAANMVEASPSLKKRLWVRRNINTIAYPARKSELRILSSEPRNAAGHNPTTVFYDELASWGAHAREIWDHLQPSTIARRNPLHFVIGHAGFNLSTVGHEQFTYALGCQNSDIIDTSFHPLVYTIPDELDWRDESNWPLANPSLGHTVTLDALREQFRTCQNDPMAEARFQTLNCNRFVGSAEAWIAGSTWSQCATTIKEEDFYGSEATVGIDFSRTHDLTAYVICVVQDGVYYLLPRFFIPGDCARDKEKKDKVPYTRWANQPNSNLYLTSGDVIDPRELVNRIVEDSKRFNLLEVGYDPHGFELLRQELEFDHGLPMVNVPQTVTNMAEPINHFYKLVLDQRLRHPDNPVLNFCLGNTRPREDRQERVMLEKASPTARIDGIIASVIAVGRMMSLGDGDTLMPVLM